ncbi:methylated-DNA--[protein]-cysteine S-methyltransferase [Spongiivirga sp. MCCC 1A20706]|uniref:methylated-DNA--[protein]-cysteine S-methyltransferase n=1 Tax=Spongiivirga sp. MCCC 1A20706 TaxID=3160963 RepID=UPI003977DAB3
MEEAIIHSPVGFIKIEGDITGIQAITFLEGEHEISKVIPEILEDVVYQLNEYFEGNRKAFNVKLNPQGTDFQKQVWNELLNISFSKTRSYLEQTKAIGDVKAIRAVAAANGKNPISIIIPCHRVIGSDGSLTGYAGGLWRKKWLLAHENPVKQTSLF